MKFLSIIASTLLPLAVFGSPLQSIRSASPEAIVAGRDLQRTPVRTSVEHRDAEAAPAGIFKRATCDIVHVVTTVDCWFYPTHGHKDDGNKVIKSIPGDTNNIKFTCYARCENVQGITYVFSARIINST
jgi:hypothetical protein